MDLEESVRSLLVQACGTEAVLRPGTDLLEEGLLDSLAMIELLEGLEDLGVILYPTQVPRECFRTVEGILALVAKATETGPDEVNHETTALRPQ